MDQMIQRRLVMTAIGTGAGAGLFALYRMAEVEVLTGRLLLVVAVFVAVFAHGVLAMVGPLRPLRAAFGALALAAGVAGLVGVASLRYVQSGEVLISPLAGLAALVLALVPLPFWVAEHGPGWRDYRALFTQAWGIVVRMAAAWAFVGVVWGVVLLSDTLLKVVGLTVISDILDVDIVPWLITGGVLGLALAVVQELSDYVSPYLVLRLLRLLLPVVVVVTAVFLAALPMRGLSGLFGGLSVALTLLAMVGAGATLVTTAVDCDDAQATQSAALIWGARGLALMLPVLAVLAAWAVWLRVDQHGWTPERVFAAQVAALGVGYGLFYAVAVLRGTGWMARIRTANVTIALALMGLAALTLTPVMNAERISTASQMARFGDGRLDVSALDPNLLEGWGRAGTRALEALRLRAAEPGQEALALRLAADAQEPGGAADLEVVMMEVKARLPLQPETATATRDIYLDQMEDYTLRNLLQSCRAELPGGGRGCVMVVADLLPDVPGEEAILAERSDSGYIGYSGFSSLSEGAARTVRPTMGGQLPQAAEGVALMRQWQAAPPALAPAPVFQLIGPQGGVMLLP